MKKVIYFMLGIIFVLLIEFCFVNCNFKNNCKKVKILLSTYDGEERCPAVIVDEIIKYAKENNIEIDYKDAKKSRKIQIRDVVNAKKEGYDGVICMPLDELAVSKISSEIGDIPLVLLNNNPGKEYLKSNKIIYIGSNEEEAAKIQAEYICSKYYNKDYLNIVILEGIKDQDTTEKRTRALKNYLRDSNINVKYVFEDNADWKSDKAYEKFNVFLKTKQPFDCIVCNNDAMALGVCKSYKENNINFNDHPIIGIDAAAQAIESIKNNEIQLTVYQSAAYEGKYSLDSLCMMINGESIDKLSYSDDECKNIWIPLIKVTKENADNFK